MNHYHLKKIDFVLFGFLILCLSFQSCIHANLIQIERDEVYSSERVKVHFFYRRAEERYSPLLSVEQTIVKEILSNSTITYKVFDIVTLQSTGFKLDNKVFILIGGQVYPVKVDQVEAAVVPNFKEKREDILTADSTKVSVVTGYTSNNNVESKLSYSLDRKLIDKMKKAQEVRFRYYAGPDMITVKLQGLALDRLVRFTEIQ